MHHAIWVEHDGSWTWSIEEGKAFEDDHAVLARDEGFPTRGDAKEAMQKAWARLLDEGKKPGRPGKRQAPAKAAAAKPQAKTDARADAATSSAFSPALPEWAVIVDGSIVAMFARKAVAQKFAKANHGGGHSLERVLVGAVARD